jgi:alkanesulfonate monooxygenase SsuD/methylene tetrahydromethanopterin reductase-like flavin-dependent oxidoreductase (luciferase family)
VSLEISLGLWQDRPADEALRTAALADELGFPAVWIGELATYDVFALASRLALRHARLVLGPLAVPVRDPVMIAMGVASVAALTGRPVAVALGTSSPLVVEQWHGRSRARCGGCWTAAASTGTGSGCPRPGASSSWPRSGTVRSGRPRRPPTGWC